MELMIFLLVIVVLLFFSGYFSATETALFSLPSTKIRTYQNSQSPRNRLIANLVLRPRDLLVTVFMLNTLVNILIQNTMSAMSGPQASWFFKVILPFFLMLILGEIIPKNFGLQNNIWVANLVAPSINFMQNALKPIRTLIVRITAPVSRIMFFYLKPDESISKDELKHVLATSQEFGVLHPDEAELAWGYLKLQDATVKSLMRPRDDILYYDIEDPLSRLTYLFVDLECSRMPVCEGSLDKILGIITTKQYLLNRHQIKSGEDLKRILLPPMYIPENTPAKPLFLRLYEHNQEIAMVVDEYGAISGLITCEDLIEEVIGDISDMRDSQALFTKAGPDEIIANGRMELSEFNDYFDVNLTSENNMVTLGGWLIEMLGDIPKSSTKCELEGFSFHILASDPRKIRRIYARKLPQSSEKK